MFPGSLVSKNSPAMIDWRRHVLARPDIVYESAKRLAVGGHQTRCARASWRAIMVHDTADMTEYGPGFNRRFSTPTRTAKLDCR